MSTFVGKLAEGTSVVEPRCDATDHQFFVVDKSNAQAPGGCWAFVMCLKCSLSKIVKPRP